MTLAIPLVIAIIGLLLWVLASNPKVAEAGRIIFFCGTFVFTSQVSGVDLRIGR